MDKKQQELLKVIEKQFGPDTERWLNTANKLFRGRPPLYFLINKIYEPFYNLIGQDAFKSL